MSFEYSEEELLALREMKLSPEEEQQDQSLNDQDALYKSFKINPAYDFSGCYLNPKQELVICHCSEYETKKSEYAERINKAEVKTHRVEYPLGYLKNLQNTILEYQKAFPNHEVIENITGTNIDIRKNKLNVYLKDCSKIEVEKFKQSIIDTDALLFEETTDNNFLQTVYSGQGILNFRNGFPQYDSSTGYPARINGVNGFVLSGHSTQLGDDMRLNTTTSVGTVQYHNFINYSSYDAAWMNSTNNSRILHNASTSLSTQVDTSPYAAVGTIAYKVGASTGHTYGNVSSHSATFTSMGVTVVNLSLVQGMGAAGGDSGAPVYIVRGGQRVICGTVTAGSSSLVYYSKAALIQLHMGASPY